MHKRPMSQHVIIEKPGADPAACARVKRTSALVEEFLRSPHVRGLPSYMCSIAVHMVSEWLGLRHGHDAPWERFEAHRFVADLPLMGWFEPATRPAMLEAIVIFLDRMAATGRVDRAFATRAIGELREAWPRLSTCAWPLKMPEVPASMRSN